MELVRL
jgi:hypothetical protein